MRHPNPQRIRATAFTLALIGTTALGIASAPAAAFHAKNKYEQLVAVTCANAYQCIVEFLAVPAGKVRTIASVSCVARVNGSAPILYMNLGTNRVSDGQRLERRTHLVPTLVGTNGSVRHYMVNHTLTKHYIGGEQPYVLVQVNPAVSGLALECQIAGTTE